MNEVVLFEGQCACTLGFVYLIFVFGVMAFWRLLFFGKRFLCLYFFWRLLLNNL